MRGVPFYDCTELLRLVRALERENARLRVAVARAMCGDLHDAVTSCMLARHHEGDHAWQSPDGETVTRWARAR